MRIIEIRMKSDKSRSRFDGMNAITIFMSVKTVYNIILTYVIRNRLHIILMHINICKMS